MSDIFYAYWLGTNVQCSTCGSSIRAPREDKDNVYVEHQPVEECPFSGRTFKVPKQKHAGEEVLG